MRQLVLHLDLADFRRGGSEDVVGDIDDEVCPDRLLVTFFPISVDQFLFLAEFFRLVADEEAGDVVVVLRRGECLEGQQVLLDLLKLLLGRQPLVLVDLGSFVHLSALLEVGVRIELLEDVQDSLFARPENCFARLLRVPREDPDVSRQFLYCAAAFPASLHPYERIIIKRQYNQYSSVRIILLRQRQESNQSNKKQKRFHRK